MGCAEKLSSCLQAAPGAVHEESSKASAQSYAQVAWITVLLGKLAVNVQANVRFVFVMQ